MSALPKPDNATQLARDNLLKIYARCQQDRHAYFPETAAELINNNPELRVIVFSTRGLGFCQQLDQIEAAVRLKGGRIEALVHDVDDKDNLQNPYIAGYKQVTADAFFANPQAYQGCLIVDRTCTWYPGIRYKVRLKQAGFTVLRVEQFLNAPGLEAAGGSYRLMSCWPALMSFWRWNATGSMISPCRPTITPWPRSSA